KVQPITADNNQQAASGDQPAHPRS
ncbi:hypothetical protein ACQWB2_24690, partial [Salmonella enterica subsp. enterica serovar Infantis]